MARGIYKIINVVNSKFYVGSAVDLKRRKTRHFSELRTGKHNNRHLQAAWTKYGEHAFVFVVIEELATDADLLAAENIWLREHVGQEYCYSIGVDATAPMTGMSGELSPTWGYRHTESSLQKIGEASKQRITSPEANAKRRVALLGKPRSTEVRAKISAALTGEKNPWYGKKRPDHGAKVSKPVLATGPQGQELLCPSVTAARRILMIKPPTINRALKNGLPITRGKMSGWTFKYIDT